MSMNAARVKFLNRSRVLNLIRRRTNPSRQEIAEAIGLPSRLGAPRRVFACGLEGPA